MLREYKGWNFFQEKVGKARSLFREIIIVFQKKNIFFGAPQNQILYCHHGNNFDFMNLYTSFCGLNVERNCINYQETL